jgi:hypothetical protein
MRIKCKVRPARATTAKSRALVGIPRNTRLTGNVEYP